MSYRHSLSLLALCVLFCGGCGAGRGTASVQAHRIVLPDGSQVAMRVLVVAGPVGEPSVDAAIAHVQQSASAFWKETEEANAWTALAWDIRNGLTRDRYVERLQRDQLESWYRIDLTPRDKAEATERRHMVFDAVNRHLTDGDLDDTIRAMRDHAASLNPPAAAACQALAEVARDDDALLHVVAAYNQGVFAALRGDIRQGHAFVNEAKDWAVRHVTVDIIRQCDAGQREIDALEKQRILLEVDERNRRKNP